MTLTIALKQNLLYVLLVLSTIIIAFFAYQTIEERWLFLKKGDDFFLAKDFRSAIISYHKSLELEVPLDRVSLNLGNSYIAEGNFERGSFYLKEYLKSKPKDKKARLLLANSLNWQKKFQEAEVEYKKVLELEHDK
jgi:tetratricopeptide (TPR) repeat protein